MTDEIWNDIVGYSGIYRVSDRGRVKSLWYGNERILKLSTNKRGYVSVMLYKDGKSKTIPIHRLVGLTFLEPVDGCKQIDHINRVRKDNRVENLRWANCKTQSLNRETVIHATRAYIVYADSFGLISRWRVSWKYDGEGVKCKHFMTKDLAEAFRDTLDKTKLVSRVDGAMSASNSERIPCDNCGSILSKNSMHSHKKSKTCLNFKKL